MFLYVLCAVCYMLYIDGIDDLLKDHPYGNNGWAKDNVLTAPFS